MKRPYSGFTLVELIVVIATIGILATITVIGLTRYQADTRDARRVSSVQAISESLEKYYDANGEYPSCSAVTATASTLTKDTLKGLSSTTVRAPQAPSGESNSIKCGAALTVAGADFFEYVGDGSSACTGSVSCLRYTLKYKDEATAQIKSIQSRRNTSIATSGAATMSVTNTGFDTISVQWTEVPNASAYLVQASLSASFSSPIEAATSAGQLTQVMNGLSVATTYYFRVRADSGGTQGNWSNTISATTQNITAPVCTGASSSSSQITVNWNSVANATSYNLRYSTSAAMTSPITTNGLTGTSRVVTGLAAGTTYYFQVMAVNGSINSGWSIICSQITNVPPPTCNASTLNSNTQITPSWSAVGGATSYTFQYATNPGFASPSTITGITSTSRTVSGLNNGTTYYFRVAALSGATSSVYASCPSATTGVSGPTSVGWSGRGEAVRCYTCVAWMPGQDPGYGSTWWTVGMYIYGSCEPGATVVTRLYSYYARSNGSSANDASLMDWTWGNQERHIVSGDDSWYGWFQGWVACQIGSTRAGDTYLGNAGPY
jgi:prepilin-type N-terminal cleavage/methylation domain-containing protein